MNDTDDNRRVVASVELTPEQQAEIKQITNRSVTKLEFVELDEAELRKAPGLARGLNVVVACW